MKHIGLWMLLLLCSVQVTATDKSSIPTYQTKDSITVHVGNPFSLGVPYLEKGYEGEDVPLQHPIATTLFSKRTSRGYSKLFLSQTASFTQHFLLTNTLKDRLETQIFPFHFFW